MLICDPVGMVYGATVLFIASNVIIFSKFYINEDPFINRFSVLVILFVASIMILIFVPHFIALLLG
jgi:NADH-ubiquinone oxidoreductase chain 5